MYFCTEVSNDLKFLSRFNILDQTVPKADESFTLIIEKLCFKVINFKFKGGDNKILLVKLAICNYLILVTQLL